MQEKNKSPTQQPDSFQFTIGKMLILFFVLAVLISVFRWLYYNYPQVLSYVILMFSTILPFMGAIATLYSVSRHLPNRRRIQAWTTFLLTIPLLGMGGLALLETMRLRNPPARNMANATGSMGLASMTTADILKQRLPRQVDQPWVWNELRDRANAGELSHGEAKEAIEVLTAGWQSKNILHRRILTWADKFIDSAIANQLLSQEEILKLVKAYAGPLQVDVPRLRADAKGMHINIEYGNHRDIKAAGILLWEPEIYLDEELIQPRVQNHHASGYSAVHQESVKTGDHEVKIVMNCALIAQEKMVGLNRYRLPRKSWPKALQTWQETVKVPVKVFSPDESIVKLVTDPELSPAQNLRIERIVAQSYVSRDNTMSKKVVIKLSGNKTHLPYCFQVFVDDGTNEHRIGSILGFLNDDEEWVARMQTEGIIKTLGDDVHNVDVLLRPDAKLIEFESRAEKMWGKSLKFPSVPIERLDLEATSDD